jgi:hypothetical protein
MLDLDLLRTLRRRRRRTAAFRAPPNACTARQSTVSQQILPAGGQCSASRLAAARPHRPPRAARRKPASVLAELCAPAARDRARGARRRSPARRRCRRSASACRRISMRSQAVRSCCPASPRRTRTGAARDDERLEHRPARRLLPAGELDLALGQARCRARPTAWHGVAGAARRGSPGRAPAVRGRRTTSRWRCFRRAASTGSAPWTRCRRSGGAGGWLIRARVSSGVQAAVASGLGISILAADAVLADHRMLGPQDGFPDPAASELALVSGPGRLDRAANQLVDYLVGALDAAMGRQEPVAASGLTG